MKSLVPQLLAFATLSFALLASRASAQPLALDPAGVVVEAEVRATGHTFTARVTEPQIELQGDVGTGGITDARLVFRWDAVRTGNTSRDAEMLQWAQAARFPEVAFTLTSIEHADGGAVAHGTLTMHGKDKAILFPFEIRNDGENGRTISGRVAIDHRDWNLPRIRTMLFIAVDPVVTVRFVLPFRRS